MNVVVRDMTLPSLIDRASKALLGARSSAEILEARDMASVAYTTAKAMARIGKAKNAHDAVVAAAHRAQADALEIEAGAKRRLADEYDAAQERGEVSPHGGRHTPTFPEGKLASAEDVGLSHKVIYEARKLRDAEQRSPGKTRSALDALLEEGKEPTKAALRRKILREDGEYEFSSKELSARDRGSFLLRAQEAKGFAFYKGKVDAKLVEFARGTATAWCELVETLEKQL